MRSRSALVTIGAALSVAAVLAGCSQQASTNTGSKGDDELVIACGAQEDWCQAISSAFQSKTGIETNYVRLSSGEALARLEASKDNPEFDVWHGGPADGYEAATEAGLLEAYTSDRTDEIPEEFKGVGGYWTGVYLGVMGFCSNTEVLGSLGVDAPTSWDDLLDPKFKQQVGIAHPGTSGTSYTALWTQVSLNGGDTDAAMEYMKQLNSSVLQYSKSGSAPGQQAGRGEIATGIIFTHDCVKYQEEGLTNLEVTIPEEGTGYEIGGLAILKNAHHPKAAEQFVDFAASTEGQEIGATVGSYQIPTNPKAQITDQMVNLADVQLVEYDFVAAGKAKSELVARFDSEIATAPTE